MLDWVWEEEVICGMRQAGRSLLKGPRVRPLKLTTSESAGKVAATARSPSRPLYCAEVWKPWQEAEGSPRRMHLVSLRTRAASGSSFLGDCHFLELWELGRKHKAAVPYRFGSLLPGSEPLSPWSLK